MLLCTKLPLYCNARHHLLPCRHWCRVLSTSSASARKKSKRPHNETSKNKKENTDRPVAACKKEYKHPTKKYRHTIFLPSTTFSSNVADMREYETTLQKECSWANIYEQQREQSVRQVEFVLHDGPPYANGDLHVGHALNKILKDVTGRQKLLQGYKLHFIPGWDCHGLPIELNAQKENMNADAGHDADGVTTAALQEPLHIRRIARKFSEKWVEKQKRGFLRWGVLADWDNAYLTSQPRYIARQLNIFDRLMQQGLIYRGLLPVYYSPSSHTTLAESELEYNDKHESPALLLAVRAQSLSSQIKCLLSSHQLNELYLSIYTTTPWTLPVNRCICYNPDVRYSIVQVTRSGKKHALVWATSLLTTLDQVDTNWKLLGSLDGSSLSSMQYYQPVTGELCPVLAAGHVTASTGTGLVHTAPAHGKEDFAVGQQHGLDLSCPIDERGCYEQSTGPELSGLPVLEKGNEAVMSILESLERSGGSGGNPRVLVLQLRKLIHSYPYDWRTKQPVMVKASRQWFIDTPALLDKAKDAVSQLLLLPRQDHSASSLTRTLDRPHWCISRQRAWGAPIPVFYDAHTGDTLQDRSIVPHVSAIIEREGSDAWWKLTVEELLPPAVLQQYTQSGRPLPLKGKDILDIWMDSGCSWQVLEGRTADLVIEGEDQYGGWFQSLLLTGLADRNSAPYRAALVHGIAVDETGRKMSKSEGNVVDPMDITDGTATSKALGADVLRWWVCHNGMRPTNPPCGAGVLFNSKQEVFRLRTIFSFLLGCLADYPGDRPDPDYKDLPLLEKYALHMLHSYDTKVWEHYGNYSYSNVTYDTVEYIATHLSRDYFHAIKHKLYCGERDGQERRSIQYVLQQILRSLMVSLTPVLPHLTQDVARHFCPGVSPQLEIRTPLPGCWHNPTVDTALAPCLLVKKQLGVQSDEENVRSLTNVDITILAHENLYHELMTLQSEESSNSSLVCDLMQAASVTILKRDNNVALPEHGFELVLSKSPLSRCLRCRKCRTDQGTDLCSECSTFIHDYYPGDVTESDGS
uniref:isoleucine--tRNA ligase n=1 Tax=Hirondellea gigas TaxID=1518452 RepID=A0A2P2I931_9CRUS